MKKLFAAGSFLALIILTSVSASATTWIGTINDSHCTPEHKALPGDDARCIVFIANDKQVYTVENQDAIKPHVGHEVSLVGTLNEELVIGISYETQGIIHANSVKMLTPVAVSPADQIQFQTWMKGLQPEMGEVRKAVIAKDNAAVVKEAKKLVTTFDEVNEFWKKQHNDDAVQYAVTARDAAKAMTTATKQVEQTIAMQKIQGACSGCHVAHRSGKTGSFTIQQ